MVVLVNAEHNGYMSIYLSGLSLTQSCIQCVHEIKRQAELLTEWIWMVAHSLSHFLHYALYLASHVLEFLFRPSSYLRRLSRIEYIRRLELWTDPNKSEVNSEISPSELYPHNSEQLLHAAENALFVAGASLPGIPRWADRQGAIGRSHAYRGTCSVV